MVKLNFSNQNECLIDWNLETYKIKNKTFEKFEQNYIFRGLWNVLFLLMNK